jgi:hypothetical protein
MNETTKDRDYRLARIGAVKAMMASLTDEDVMSRIGLQGELNELMAEEIARKQGWRIDGDGNAFVHDDGVNISITRWEARSWVGLCARTDIDLEAHLVADNGEWRAWSDQAEDGEMIIVEIDQGGGPEPFRASWDDDLDVCILEYCNRGYWGRPKRWMPMPPDAGLPQPAKNFADTFSAETVLLDAFFQEKR